MAAGSSGAGIELQKELICAICLDYFNEPVILKCGHNFCKFCILMHWEENGGEDVGYQCPECRMIFNKISFTKNYLVKNLVDKLSGLECLKPCEQPAPSKRFQIDGKCDRHGEELKLYCHTDNKPICVVCRESRAHRHHDVAPVPEVLEDMKSELRLRLVELTWQKTVCTRVKAMDEQTKNEAKLKKLKLKEKIEEDVGSLVQFLLDEKDDLLEALDAEEGTVIGMIDDNLRWVETEVVAVDKHMAQIHNHIRGNTSFESITETYNNPLKVSPLISSVNCSGDWMNEFSGPHQLILWKRMMHVLHTMPQNLTLDPDTAHPNLAITDFDTKVEEVDVKDKGVWYLGVTGEYSPRKGFVNLCPSSGYWSLSLQDRLYANEEDAKIPLADYWNSPRVGVYLDYDAGRVSFYDAVTMKKLYMFEAYFEEPVSPFFSPGKNDPGSRLQICHYY
ncbi:E3 ubiquitin-protein ligase TRIM47 isoform X2 [Oncorhynchus mykiss]|uniref:E3 ubiquitin-protein ligase TRIM47 isoform X2 n=1 Tax=Oncorhynchus mykiss TaxID=8022 RepID=UPI0018776061|nr:E3 ubiquitin-protein ligase TRIM47 isoform X2 [Oncorhynchus mykiss]